MVITYTAMIYGYCKSGDMKDAAKLLAEMVEKGIVLNTVTYNTLTNRFYKEGNVEEGLKICNQMSQREVALDEITYTTLIHGWQKPCPFKKQEWFGHFKGQFLIFMH